jgi:hypothetical protein
MSFPVNIFGKTFRLPDIGGQTWAGFRPGSLMQLLVRSSPTAPTVLTQPQTLVGNIAGEYNGDAGTLFSNGTATTATAATLPLAVNATAGTSYSFIRTGTGALTITAPVTGTILTPTGTTATTITLAAQGVSVSLLNIDGTNWVVLYSNNGSVTYA